MPTDNQDSSEMPTVRGLRAGQGVGGGRFRLVKPLGEGGMGVVWQAMDETLREPVALKFLPASIRNDPTSLEDLRHETIQSRRLAHPSIVKVYDLHEGTVEDPFISMEYVEGRNLAQERANAPGKVLVWSFLSPYILQLCEALEYAHAEKVIHRDLKPSNVLIDVPRNRIKLADFGIARALTDSVTRVTLQRPTGGTVAYMSCQQLNGEPPCPGDDLYSLGATLYELLTSKPPFYSGDIPWQIRYSEVTPIQKRLQELKLTNDVPRHVQDAVLSILDRDPARRPGSVREAAELLGLLETRRPTPRSSRRSSRPGRAAAGGARASGAGAGAANPESETGPSTGSAPPTTRPSTRAARTPRTPRTGDRRAEAADDSAPTPRLPTEPANIPGTEPVPGTTADSRANPAMAAPAAAASGVRDPEPSSPGTEPARASQPPATPSAGGASGSPTPEGSQPAPSHEPVVTDRRYSTTADDRSAEAVAALGERRPDSRFMAREQVRQEPASAQGRRGGPLLWVVALLILGVIGVGGWWIFLRPDASNSAAVGNKEPEKAVVGAGVATPPGSAVTNALVRASGTEVPPVNPPAAAPTAPATGSAADAGRPPERAQEPASAPPAIAEVPSPGPARSEPQVASVPVVTPAEESKPARPPWPQTGQSWTNSLGMRFLPVPGVSVLFGMHETRVQDFDAFVVASGLRSPGRAQTNRTASGPDHPASSVTWTNARLFCAWLTRKEQEAGQLGAQQSYRLPLDLEWSMAVGLEEDATKTPRERATRNRDRYPWGTGWPPPARAGNYLGREARRDPTTRGWDMIDGFEDGVVFTAPVGSFAANAFGLHDLGGNVWEWCEDPLTPRSADRVLRGGAWKTALAQHCLAAYRESLSPSLRADNASLVDVGFRCVLVVGAGE